MSWKRHGLLLLCVSLLSVAPARAQSGGCNSSQTAAVQCFVKNAVNTGLAILPAGMTLSQFQSYGVAVSHIVQSPTTAVLMLGVTGAIADALLPTNADGTANPSAQDSATNAIVDAALNNRLVSLPASTTVSQLKMFAHQLTVAIAQDSGVTVSTGTLLRLLDSYLISGTVNGTVDWNQVSTNISSTVDGLIGAGLLKLPATIPAGSVKEFANGVTVAIYNYKLATGKASL